MKDKKSRFQVSNKPYPDPMPQYQPNQQETDANLQQSPVFQPQQMKQSQQLPKFQFPQPQQAQQPVFQQQTQQFQQTQPQVQQQPQETQESEMTEQEKEYFEQILAMTDVRQFRAKLINLQAERNSILIEGIQSILDEFKKLNERIGNIGESDENDEPDSD